MTLQMSTLINSLNQNGQLDMHSLVHYNRNKAVLPLQYYELRLGRPDIHH